jgi:hypothetical protein
MRDLRIGFIAAVMMVFAGYGVATAAPTPAAPTIDPGHHAQGMKEAPAILQTTGRPCDLTDAYYFGTGTAKIDGKNVPSKIYEVACKDSMGYFLVSLQGQAPQAYDCLVLKTESDEAVAKGGKPGELCILPGNANPAAGLAPLVAQGGVAPCSIAGGRYLGGSATDLVNMYEARCTDGRGYLMMTPQPGSQKTLTVVGCAEGALFGAKCALTSDAEVQEQIIALAKPSNPAACQISAARWVLATVDGWHYYEISCADGKSGYMFRANNSGTVKDITACANAQKLGDGCTLTNIDVARTAEAGLYTQQAKQIGYHCTVTKYQSLGLETGSTKREVVELSCAEHPGSVWSLLPTGSGGDPVVVNCLRAQAYGLPSCKLAPTTATYADLAAEIKSKGKTCTVNNARYIDGVRSQNGEDFVEVACGEGGGLIVAYSPATIEAVANVFTCKEAAGTSRACTLGK